MSTVEAARHLGVGREAVISAIRRGNLGAHKLGRDWLVPVAELERYSKERRPVGRPRKTA
ncbi:helix-turn-helix domain-containing protein [Botrimarina mediterranea]|uniref:helix-turn-helix domain-containing protein n=1 Tax=Botrimarina mediterranea TaxID=2528022 RepID=UPI003AF31F76